MDLFAWMGSWLSGIADKTAFSAVILALVSASLGALGYVGKLLDTSLKAARKDRKLYRSAVIRFYNDVVIWQKDFKATYTGKKFDDMAMEIVTGGKDFKFSVPASDQSDQQEIMKFIHRMTTTEARTIRTFMVYSVMLNSIQRILGSDLATFDPERKMRALGSFRELSTFVSILSNEVVLVLKSNRFLREKNDRVDSLLNQREMMKADTETFVKEKIALLTTSEDT